MSKQITSEASRLLLVDDEPEFMVTPADCLRRAGFDVLTAASANEAIEFVRRDKFAVVIINYAMRDGLDAAATFAKLHQPFMFLSAYKGSPHFQCNNIR